MENIVANNTFIHGMNGDITELSMAPDVMTSALNATVSTLNGNEGAVQNDMGNCKIKNNGREASLPSKSIPLGLVEFGGIVYIALKVQYKNGDDLYWTDQIGSFPSPNYESEESEGKLIWDYQPLHVGLKKDSLIGIPFETNKLNFQFENPVSMLAEPSYDGTVNLIINDGINKPKLINTGFAVRANENYEIIKRLGDNNTNRYDLSDGDIGTINFNLLTSLYRDTYKISKFIFNGIQTGGCLKVGNYVFYAVTCDKDGNESDIICESGMIPVFHGSDGDPFSIYGGIALLTSDKSISITLDNIDESYSYIKLYYSIAQSENSLNHQTIAYKINTPYKVEKNDDACYCEILVTGFEDFSEVSLEDLNVLYFNADSAKTLALSSNILFLGNLQENYQESSEFDDLKRLSLKVVPLVVINKGYLEQDIKFDLTPKYTSLLGNNYYNSKFIYDYTGYHYGEIYRFGIVYIRKDGSLTSVFNTLGVLELTDKQINAPELEDFNDTTHLALNGSYNDMGVCRIAKGNGITDIIGLKFTIPDGYDDILENYKGYFIVRLKRMPTLLASGVLMPICETSYLPGIPVSLGTKKGYLFESFCKTTVSRHSASYDYYYPKSTGKGYRLTNNYENRLFTLTDNTRVYFDKLIAEDPVTVFISTELLDGVHNEFFLGWTSYVYGGVDQDSYLALVITDTYNPGHGGHRGQRYDCCLYFFTKDKAPTNYTEGLGKYNLKSQDELAGYFNQFGSDGEEEEGNAVHNTYEVLRYAGRGFYYDSDFTNCYIQFEETWYKGFLKVSIERDKDIEDMRNLVTNYFNWYASEAVTNIKITETETTSNVNNGFKLDSTTFDGKYAGYPDVTNPDKDTSVLCYPVEYNSYALFSPEMDLNAPYITSLFSGQKTTLLLYDKNSTFIRGTNKRHYVRSEQSDILKDLPIYGWALGVPEGVSLLTINHGEKDFGSPNFINRDFSTYFSSKAGDSNEISFKYAGPEYVIFNDTKDWQSTSNCLKQYTKLLYNQPCNIVRGIYGSYIGVTLQEKSTASAVESGKLANLYIPNYNINNLLEYFKLRYADNTPYYAISDRVSITEKTSICFRGDCFINQFTHRVNRNFNDTNAPYNDIIINPGCFSENFEKLYSYEYRTFDLSKDAEAALKINIGDLNAVQLGNWVTYPVRTSMNTALRGIDESYVSEVLACGHARKFYPLLMDVGGSNKIPESTVYNNAYSKSGGDKLYMLRDVIYDNTYYKNRIVYSDVVQTFTTANGNRKFLQSHYKDYTDLYGAIVKMFDMPIGLSGNSLVVICEHGVLLLPINERLLAAEGSGGNVFINSSNVLPNAPVVLSDTYGSKFPDSIIKTPYGIFGVDESSKVIWVTDGTKLQVISEFGLSKFLNLNLKIPSIKIGSRNLKTFYNASKRDVIFTLYNMDSDLNKSPDILWSVCWNLHDSKWMTFYSWIPLMMANIGNNSISVNLFNSKYIWKHGLSERIPSEAIIKPTNWYGELHPFEIEFVVNKSGALHKIFDNMQIISNKAKPESFHYEIVGDCFDFASDKLTMYKRLELTKMLMNKVGGSKISYNWEIFDSTNPDKFLKETRAPKSTICPMYYERLDIINLVYDNYKQLKCPSYDYDALSGTEIMYYPELHKEFRLCNHVKGVDIEGPGGVLRGNMRYLEDVWKVQITPISILLANESWNKNVPIALPTIKVNDLTINNASAEEIKSKMGFLPAIRYWDISRRNEIKLKDKYMKTKIRYKGDELAIIQSVNTICRPSFS